MYPNGLGRREFIRLGAQVAGGLGLMEATEGVSAQPAKPEAKQPSAPAAPDRWMERVMPHGIRRAWLMTPRTPENDAELRYWLENMIVDHRYSVDEASLTTGFDKDQVQAAMARFGIDGNQPARHQGSKLRMVPYPGGGRHPRIGCIEGAINPQRDTKISVFTPWDPESYVVADLPEAIWSNLGLTYLAHTDIQTVWEERGIPLKPMEWMRHEDGSLSFERELPNGIRFGTKAVASSEAIHMELWLSNHTDQTLTDLHVQNCVMFKGAAGFQRQTSDNRVMSTPYVAAPYEPTSDRWVITAWEHSLNLWGNALCPCIHSDPKFPDCLPGQTQRLQGWLSFYNGRDIDGELKRIDNLGWRTV